MFMNTDGLEHILLHWVMPVAEMTVFATWLVVHVWRQIIDIIRGK